jgi:hypothetical protein
MTSRSRSRGCGKDENGFIVFIFPTTRSSDPIWQKHILTKQTVAERSEGPAVAFVLAFKFVI